MGVLSNAKIFNILYMAFATVMNEKPAQNVHVFTLDPGPGRGSIKILPWPWLIH